MKDIDIRKLALDQFGRVVLADSDLEAIEQHDHILTAGGVNTGCTGSNSSCANNGCPGSQNTNCINATCDYTTNLTCENRAKK